MSRLSKKINKEKYKLERAIRIESNQVYDMLRQPCMNLTSEEPDALSKIYNLKAQYVRLRILSSFVKFIDIVEPKDNLVFTTLLKKSDMEFVGKYVIGTIFCFMDYCYTLNKCGEAFRPELQEDPFKLHCYNIYFSRIKDLR